MMNRQKDLRTRRFALPLLALATIALVAAVPASATSLAWTASGVTVYGSDTSLYAYVADVFTANSNETVTALGVEQLPYTNSFELIGLYNSSGQNIASLNLNNYTAPSSDGYLWATFTGVQLTAGQTYTLVIYTDGATNPAYGYSSTAPTTGWATFDNSEYEITGSGQGLANPAGDGVSSTYYDLNMLATPTPTAVPEPESLLLLGSGLVGLAGFLRFKLRKS